MLDAPDGPLGAISMSILTRVAIAFLFMSSLHAQVTLNVPSTSYPTIQSAMNAAAAGDTVLVAPGTYTENLNFPSVDFSLQGSGMGVTIVDGGAAGSCITMSVPLGQAAAVQDLTLRNGSAARGGGIDIDNGLSGALIEPSIRRVEFLMNTADQGGALYIEDSNAIVLAEDCVFRQNSAQGTLGQGSAIYVANLASALYINRCLFDANAAQRGTVDCEGGWLLAANCAFVNNTAADVYGIRLGQGSHAEIRASAFLLNAASAGEGAIRSWDGVQGFFGPSFAIRDCLIAVNLSPLPALNLEGDYQLVNVTLLHDGNSTVPALRSVLASTTALVANSIVLTANAFAAIDIAGAASSTVTHSNVTGIVTTMNNIDAVPRFMNEHALDFSLAGDSPCVDAGTSNGGFPVSGLDILGNPRLVFGEVDMGCAEAAQFGANPAGRSRVGEGSGGPYDVLLVNGSTGGSERRVVVPVGSSSNLTVLQPPHLNSPADFFVFGSIGEPVPVWTTNVPFGIGDMVLTPCTLLPPGQGTFFMLADSMNGMGGPCPALTPATPAPWISQFGPAIPFPVVLGFQAVMLDSAVVASASNAVLLDVR